MTPDQLHEYILSIVSHKKIEHLAPMLWLAIPSKPQDKVIHISVDTAYLRNLHVNNISEILQNHKAYLFAITHNTIKDNHVGLFIEVITPNRREVVFIRKDGKNHILSESSKNLQSFFPLEDIKTYQDILRKNVYLQTT